MESATVKLLLVPAILALGGSLLAIIGAAATSARTSRSTAIQTTLALVGLFALALAALALPVWPREDLLSPVIKLTADPLAHYATALAVGGAILALLVAAHQPRIESSGEFLAMIFFTALGLVMVGLAADLIVLLLALELSSIPGYVLVGLSRRHRLAEEASAKYFFLGALATALLAYGFVFLYGATGQTDLTRAVSISTLPLGPWFLAVGLILAFAGLAFKITAIPFYFYTPDVYQGAAGAVTAIIAFLPKVAGFIALIRLLAFIGFDSPVWTVFWPILWVVAAGTTTVGNVLALLQTDVKRILAYSSVAHTGYMLIGLAAATGRAGGLQNGLAAVLFYVLIYGLMSLGAFATLGFLARWRKSPGLDDEEPLNLSDLAGLATLRPGLSFLLAVFLLSLTGLPPTAGFWAKVYVFTAALSPENYALILLVVIGLLNAAVAVAYYFRIIHWLYMQPAGQTYAQPPAFVPHARFFVTLGLILTVLLLLIFGLVPGKLMQLTELAAESLLP